MSNQLLKRRASNRKLASSRSISKLAMHRSVLGETLGAHLRVQLGLSNLVIVVAKSAERLPSRISKECLVLVWLDWRRVLGSNS